MSTEKLSRFWLLATFVLIAVIIISSIFIWISHDKGQPIEVYSFASPTLQGSIYIDGAITNPGIYPLKSNDNIESILSASGGANQNADFSRIRFYIPAAGEGQQPQKVDINRAETWMLQALPDIGAVRAQAIVKYRQQNGPFQNIQEITKVQGISGTTFQKIKDLISVSD